MRVARTFTALLVFLPLLLSAQFGWLGKKDYFVPTTTLSGIGRGRGDSSDAILARRTELMIDSQTFSIMRDPQALAGAQRITGAKLRKIFEKASSRTGLPASMIAAVAYLESWGR